MGSCGSGAQKVPSQGAAPAKRGDPDAGTQRRRRRRGDTGTSPPAAAAPDADLQAAGGRDCLSPETPRSGDPGDAAEEDGAGSPGDARRGGGLQLVFRTASLLDVVRALVALARGMGDAAAPLLHALGAAPVDPPGQLLSVLLRVGHTARRARDGADPASARPLDYDDERALESLLFASRPRRAPAEPEERDISLRSPTSPQGELALHPECTILLLRWLLSDPVLKLRKGQDVVRPAKGLFAAGAGVAVLRDAAARRQHARRLIDAAPAALVVDLSFQVKQGFRQATRRLVKLLLDKKKEDAIRRDQELRRTSWWQELAVKRTTQSDTAPNGDAFHQWRRKSISENAALLRPQTAKYTVVLDLDETLIYTRGRDAHLCVRPGVPGFLRRLRGLGMDVVVWTASTKDYSAAILANIDPELQWVSECVYRHPKWFPENDATQARGHPKKDLALLGRDMRFTVIVDNSIDCIVGYSESNAVLVEDFRGIDVDDTMLSLCEFFEMLVESKQTVPDYLRENGHYHFKPEWKRAQSTGQLCQCFVLDPRPSFAISGAKLRLWAEAELFVSPTQPEPARDPAAARRVPSQRTPALERRDLLPRVHIVEKK